LGEAVCHVGTEGDEAEEVAAVEREIGDALLFDDGADGGVFRGKQLGGGADFDGLADLADFEAEIDAGGLLDLQFNRGAGSYLKPGFSAFTS
jgi:hypothetical protein